MTQTHDPVSTESIERELARLLAEKEIHRILCTYCEAIDTADFALLGSLWENGTWAFAGEPGAEPVRRWFQENVLLHGDTPGTSHQLANTVIDVDLDAGTGTVRTYISVHQTAEDFPLQTIFCGRFRCTFENIDGRWWWRTQEVLPDLVGDVSRHRSGAAGTGENLI